MRDQASSTDLVEQISATYEQHRCDGLFISDINYLGIALPITAVCHQLPDRDRSFIVIDGAQAFGQRPVKLNELDCDLYLTGTQKWVQAYHPLRVAIGGRPASTATLVATHHSLIHHTRHADPLNCFCTSVLDNENESYGETVNLIALMTAAGALASGCMEFSRISHRWHMQLRNVTGMRSEVGLNVVGHASLQSAIALVASQSTNDQESTRLRHRLHQQGLVASVFHRGLVRLALPQFHFPRRFFHQIERVLWIATHPTSNSHESLTSLPIN